MLFGQEWLLRLLEESHILLLDQQNWQMNLVSTQLNFKDQNLLQYFQAIHSSRVQLGDGLPLLLNDLSLLSTSKVLLSFDKFCWKQAVPLNKGQPWCTRCVDFSSPHLASLEYLACLGYQTYHFKYLSKVCDRLRWLSIYSILYYICMLYCIWYKIAERGLTWKSSHHIWHAKSWADAQSVSFSALSYQD